MNSDWTSRPFPPLRHLLVDMLDNSRPHVNYGIGTVDITAAEARRHTLQRETRRALSFHAWTMHCLARAAMEHPTLLTYRHRKDLVTFKTVDLCTVIERRLPNGVRIPVGWTLRGAESLSLFDTNEALRQAMKGTGDDDATTRQRRKLLRLPGFIRRWVMRRIFNNPHLLRRYYGNLGLTNLQFPGMNSSFTPLPPSVCTLTIGIGTIARDVVVDAQGAPRERATLHMALAIDHAVVDGIPAAAFLHRFHELLSAATGLDDSYLADFQRHQDRA